MRLEMAARVDVFEERRPGARIVRRGKFESKIVAHKKDGVEPLVIANEPGHAGQSRSRENNQHRAPRSRQLFR